MGISKCLKVVYSRLRQRALRHNVNPTIFIVIYIASFLPYYLGIYLVLRGSGILSIGFWDLISFDFSGLTFRNPWIIWGLLINRLAWAIPYLYLEIAGRGLRWYLHCAIWMWISGSLVYFLYFQIGR